MDIQDLFEKKRTYNKKYEKPYYPTYDKRNEHSNANIFGSFNVSGLFKTILNNKKLKTTLLAAVVVLIIIIIAVIALLFPLISSVFNYITVNGVSGLYDEIVIFLDTLWNGSKY